jgi:hypothetical protein
MRLSRLAGRVVRTGVLEVFGAELPTGVLRTT